MSAFAFTLRKNTLFLARFRVWHDHTWGLHKHVFNLVMQSSQEDWEGGKKRRKKTAEDFCTTSKKKSRWRSRRHAILTSRTSLEMEKSKISWMTESVVPPLFNLQTIDSCRYATGPCIPCVSVCVCVSSGRRWAEPEWGMAFFVPPTLSSAVWNWLRGCRHILSTDPYPGINRTASVAPWLLHRSRWSSVKASILRRLCGRGEWMLTLFLLHPFLRDSITLNIMDEEVLHSNQLSNSSNDDTFKVF